MKNKMFLGGAAVVIFLAGFFFFKYFHAKEPLGPVHEKIPESFIKHSAEEMVNPDEENAEMARSQANKDLEASGTTKTIKSICEGASANDFDCYATYYDNLTLKSGVAAAFVDLKARYLTNTYVQSQCHPLTHVIGHGGAAIYKDPAVAYIYGDNFCWSGYYHGVMEEIVEKTPPDTLLSEVNSFCAKIPGKENYSFEYYNCVHGLGHGIMSANGNQLFDSLKFCDNLAGSWEQSSCWGGVFMENVIVDNKNHFTAYLKPSEPLYPCTAVDDKYKGTCYLMQTSYALKVTSGDFAKVFEICGGAGDAYKDTCYQSLGRDASGRSVSNAAQTKATCNLGKTYEERSNCIIGAVKDFISYFHDDKEATVFCDSLDTDLQNVCLTTGADYYKSFK